jgi:sugar lactone lactonase YvrE
MRRTASCMRAHRRRAEAIALLAALGCAGTLTPAAAAGQTPDAPEQAATLEIGDQPAHTTLVYPPFAHTLGIHRARPAHLQLFLGDRTRFADPQGLAAVKFASDDDPEARGDDFQLTLFGVNSGRGEILYNSSMKTLAVYGRRGSAEGELAEPHGIAAAVDGRVYVADTGNRRIVRLRWDPVARALSWVGSWPAGAPFDVDADARGNVWATDREQNAVLRYSDREASEAAESRAAAAVSGDRWPLPDDVDAPLGLAIMDSLDPWLQPNATRLYLVDHDGRRLRAYDVEGRVVASIAAADVAEGDETARFFYLEIDYFGNVYATDPGNGRIYKLDPELRPLASFAGPGPAESALEEPRGIAIWKRFGQVFVAEREGAQYFFVGTDFRPLTDPVRVRRAEEPAAWMLEGFLTEAATVRVAFLDGTGDTLAIADAGTVGTGRQVVAWDGEDWESAPAEGWEERAQKVVVEARPTYSSRRRFARVRAFPMAWEGP